MFVEWALDEALKAIFPSIVNPPLLKIMLLLRLIRRVVYLADHGCFVCEWVLFSLDVCGRRGRRERGRERGGRGKVHWISMNRDCNIIFSATFGAARRRGWWGWTRQDRGTGGCMHATITWQRRWWRARDARRYKTRLYETSHYVVMRGAWVVIEGWRGGTGSQGRRTWSTTCWLKKEQKTTTKNHKSRYSQTSSKPHKNPLYFHILYRVEPLK